MCVLTALPALHHLTHAVRSPALLQSHFSISPAFLEKAGSRLSPGRRGAWGEPSPRTQPGSRAPRVQHLHGAASLLWAAQLWISSEIVQPGLFSTPQHSLPRMNQLNPSSSLQQINTHVFPIAYCSAGCKIEFVSDGEGKN